MRTRRGLLHGMGGGSLLEIQGSPKTAWSPPPSLSEHAVIRGSLGWEANAVVDDLWVTATFAAAERVSSERSRKAFRGARAVIDSDTSSVQLAGPDRHLRPVSVRCRLSRVGRAKPWDVFVEDVSSGLWYLLRPW